MRDVAGKFWDVPDHGHFRTSLVFGTVPGFCVPILGRCWFLCSNFGTLPVFCPNFWGLCPNFGVCVGLGFVSVWVIGVPIFGVGVCVPILGLGFIGVPILGLGFVSQFWGWGL